MQTLPNNGTYFLPAFEMANDIIQLTPNSHIPLIIFLTDG